MIHSNNLKFQFNLKVTRGIMKKFCNHATPGIRNCTDTRLYNPPPGEVLISRIRQEVSFPGHQS